MLLMAVCVQLAFAEEPLIQRAGQASSKHSPEPTAASLAFTSTDAKVLAALKMLESGDFRKAEESLTARAQNEPSVSMEALRAREELVDIIGRIRFEYSLDAVGLLAKIKKSIPDATAEDVERWASDSSARFKVIDGRKLFFRREPRNIFLFSEEANKRRAAAGRGPSAPKWPLTEHLAAILAEADRTGAGEVLPIQHRVTHTLTIRNDHPAIQPGAKVRVWLPLAQEYRQQRNVRLIRTSPAATLVAPSAIEGNPVTGALQRTVYFEHTIGDVNAPLVFNEVFEYTSYAYCPKLDVTKVEPLPADWNDAYLTERAPHIVFTPAIREQVATIVGDETNPLIKARKIFRWISVNIPWNAEDEYCIIPSFALKGFGARRGDCGVQNSLFIAMCRIAGVPARWQSGFETKPGEAWGMHDWAEIYIAPWGWLPADASYGLQQSEDLRVAEFYCGRQDSYRLIVNLDWGRELFPPKQSLRSEPADFQRGEVEIDGKNLYYDAWEAKTEVER